MGAFYPVLKRELRSYFASPLAYIILVVFQIISARFFFLYLQGFLQFQLDPSYQLQTGDLNLNNLVILPYFGTISIVLLLIVPLITMRLVADEKKNYTAELLFTSPIRIRTIVFGKFIAALILLIMMLLLSSVNVFVLIVHGNPDFGAVFAGYVGLFLLGASFLSIGIFASSLTDNQLIAAVISFGILLLLWLVGALSDAESTILGYLSVINHYEDFGKGIIDLKDVVYYISLIFLGLFLTYSALESERWR
jgi:ABC-2 type transport system permease protein